jgi:hypothetical protein
LAVIYNLDASKDSAHLQQSRRGPDANTLQFANSGYQINNKISSFLVELNSKFSEVVSNKLQAGYTHLMISENRFFTSSGNKYYKDGSYIIGT